MRVVDPYSPAPAKPKPIPVNQADPWMYGVPGLTNVGTPAAANAPIPSSGPMAPPGTLKVAGTDWQKLITGDPRYQSMMGAAGSNYSAAVKAAIARLGYVPDQFKALGGFDFSDAAAAGRDNPNSTAKVLERMYGQNVSRLNAGNEQRGIFNLGVGAAAQDRDIEGVAAGQRSYDAVSSFLDQVGGYGADYNTAAAGAVNTVGTEIQQDPSSEFNDTTAHLDTGLTSQYGKPIYKHADGRLFNGDGTPFTPTPAPPPAPPAAAPLPYGWTGQGVGGI